MQTEKQAHKANEKAAGDATKSNISNAQGHAKDAAKQAVGAADHKKDQAKASNKVCTCVQLFCACKCSRLTALVMQTTTGVIDKEVNKAGATQQKEGAKSSFGAVKVCQQANASCA